MNRMDIGIKNISLHLMLWARSLGWLERSADNREVRSSNLRGPIKGVKEGYEY